MKNAPPQLNYSQARRVLKHLLGPLARIRRMDGRLAVGLQKGDKFHEAGRGDTYTDLVHLVLKLYQADQAAMLAPHPAPAPTGPVLGPAPVHAPAPVIGDAPRGSLASLLGRWPGDETDEQVAAALGRVS